MSFDWEKFGQALSRSGEMIAQPLMQMGMSEWERQKAMKDWQSKARQSEIMRRDAATWDIGNEVEKENRELLNQKNITEFTTRVHANMAADDQSPEVQDLFTRATGPNATPEDQLALNTYLDGRKTLAQFEIPNDQQVATWKGLSPQIQGRLFDRMGDVIERKRQIDSMSLWHTTQDTRRGEGLDLQAVSMLLANDSRLQEKMAGVDNEIGDILKNREWGVAMSGLQFDADENVIPPQKGDVVGEAAYRKYVGLKKQLDKLGQNKLKYQQQREGLWKSSGLNRLGVLGGPEQETGEQPAPQGKSALDVIGGGIASLLGGGKGKAAPATPATKPKPSPAPTPAAQEKPGKGDDIIRAIAQESFNRSGGKYKSVEDVIAAFKKRPKEEQKKLMAAYLATLME